MKTERRHELQTNVLAQTLSRWVKTVKPYSRAGFAIVLGALVLFFAWIYLETQNAGRTAEGWTEYYDALNSRDPRERLGEISQLYADTMVSQWARLSLAEFQLVNGTNELFADKAIANKDLREASEKFQAILIEAHHPTLLQRATYGLAQAHESQGQLAKAREEYSSIAKQWPDSPYVASAHARVKSLDQADTKSFYDWFVKYEPPRPMSKEPGSPGARPDFLKEPDESSGLKLPSLTDPAAPQSSSTDSAEQPAGSTEEKPAATEGDSADKPAAESK